MPIFRVQCNGEKLNYYNDLPSVYGSLEYTELFIANVWQLPIFAQSIPFPILRQLFYISSLIFKFALFTTYYLWTLNLIF